MQPCSKENEIREIRDMVIEHRADFKYIKETLDVMENNHLAHMQKSLEAMDERMDGFDQFRYKTLAWSAVGAVIGSLIIQFLFRYF